MLGAPMILEEIFGASSAVLDTLLLCGLFFFFQQI
jgi:hypothetical protein